MLVVVRNQGGHDVRVEPYLFFNGRCDEAIAFYRDALGATVTMLLRYKESPDAPPMPMPPGWADKVMHASLQIGETTVMASDGMSADGPRFDGFSLSVGPVGPDVARRMFDRLADGGKVQMPLGRTFFSPCFGMVVDRFGVGWMISGTEPVSE